MIDPLVGAALVSSAAGFLGARQQNRAGEVSAAKQMAFQKEMSNTSYQRSMADMKAAGLNPILAYKQGGASTPSGASYSPVNVGAAAASNASATTSALQSIQQSKKIKSEAKRIVQSTEFERVLHDERWPRLFATMSAENVVASALATLSGLDVEQVLKQSNVNAVSKTRLRDFVTELQVYNSTLQREGKGLMQGAEDVGKALADFIQNYMGNK